MRRIAFLIVVGVLACACSSARADEQCTCQACVFMMDAHASRPVIASPDRSKHVELWTTAKVRDRGSENGKFYASIYGGARRLTTIELRDLSAATFVKWSADSKEFYVMWSDGGAVGGYHVRAFIVNEDQANESPAPKAVATNFAKHHYCKMRGNNMYAIRWEGWSKQLILRPEVYPASDCGEIMGFASGYLVDLESGAVKAQYTADQINEVFQSCPSAVLPSAFATQEAVEDHLRRRGEATK